MSSLFRNLALATGGIALVLSASIAFAQEKPGGVGAGSNPGPGSQYQAASSYTRGISSAENQSGSYTSSGSTSTQASEQGSARIPTQGQAGAGHRPAMGSTARGIGKLYAAQGQARGAQMRQMAQERIAAIQDKVKQQLAQNLSGIFDRLNQVWTQHFSQLLDRYAAILQKIQDRANAAAATGKNVTATNAAIKVAQTAITNARTAVAAQAAKTYTLSLSSTSTVAIATSTPEGQGQIIQSLKDAFQTLRQQLFDDLFALRDGPMTDTRKAVQNALQTLEQIPGVDQVSATSTEATSNQ